jgi:pimeloyl-ACP methyl ester carboxylesterase
VTSWPSPLVVLVHGAWHGAWCWAALQAQLDERGIPSLAVDLPGHGTSVSPFGDLHSDAAAVTAVIDAAVGDVDERRPIVLVGHSYGGAVVSQVEHPAVAHLVYLAAYVLDVGESVISLTKAMPPLTSQLAKAMIVGDGSSTIDATLAAAAFYGHCPAPVAGASVARLGAQPYATFTQAASVASWRAVPSTYVRCTDDRAIDISHQDLMAARCTEVATLTTDHSPFASMPNPTADIIERVVQSCSGAQTRVDGASPVGNQP